MPWPFFLLLYIHTAFLHGRDDVRHIGIHKFRFNDNVAKLADVPLDVPRTVDPKSVKNDENVDKKGGKSGISDEKVNDRVVKTQEKDENDEKGKEETKDGDESHKDVKPETISPSDKKLADSDVNGSVNATSGNPNILNGNSSISGNNVKSSKRPSFLNFEHEKEINHAQAIGYTSSTYPNPTTDPHLCIHSNDVKSFLCDPDGILSDSEQIKLNRILLKCKIRTFVALALNILVGSEDPIETQKQFGIELEK
ncbi:signal peptide containing protein [Theileria equi strain WA]|uniref:Signal peptide containing protein n=1 Tax=Theileria equi strain WA TaxID=1537102 RepID=L1LFR1_THEEQ|nr:signal peptide containing protein [Theileria equi strain WA]EKX74100.1 signal peptide containing protein [Theileria equi strain WA]|eukprot:XP_004833552.1 signal peptide containing protein [Theileria equi strain WA]